MATSLQVYPATLPVTMAQGHGFTPMPHGRQRERDRGELRIRPRFRSSPEQAAVVWRFTQEEFDTFHLWYEDDLQAGSARFDVQVHRRGGLRAADWYAAQFVGDYQAQALAGLRYEVSASLLLLEWLGPVRITPGIEMSGAGVAFAGGAGLAPFVLRSAGAGVSFSGGVSFGLMLLEVAGQGVITDGSVALPLPPLALAGTGIAFAGAAEGL